jgi:phage shock protein PspC (stress-responsive transcriptional regulator)
MTGNFLSLRWTRSDKGVLAGVCRGLAEALDVDVVLVRLGWVLAFFLAGFGGLLYILLAFALPRQDKLDKAYDDKILGVCARIALKLNVEVGAVRLLALLTLALSGGGTVLAYLVLYFVLPNEKTAPAPSRPL